MTANGCESFKNKSSICILIPYFVFSRLAAITLGLAFAVVVSVVARYIQHDFLFGRGLRITKNPDKKIHFKFSLKPFASVRVGSTRVEEC